MKNQMKSLNELREEKVALRKRIDKKAKTLKHDVTDCFVPAGGPFLSSKNKYMNYIGYALTAYKTAVNVRGVMKFFARLF